MTEKPKPQKDTDIASYADAVDELKEILAYLSDSEVDVDELAKKVKRGSELINYCQNKISDAEMQVKEIVDGIGENPEN